jgi:glycosyltransferase involved in cell wall biosynthesis
MTLNRLEYTKQMFEAINRISGYDFDWFVLDQGSTDGTVDWLLKNQDVRTGHCVKKFYAWHKENIGIAKGWMECIKNIKMDGNRYDIVIKVDNDALMMTQDWLKDMVDIFERNQQVVLSPYVEGLEDSPGGVLRSRPDGQSPYVLINDKVMGMVPNLGGIVFASYMKLYDGFNFPEDIQGNKDYYLSKYAQSIGFNLLYMEELKVKHLGGKEGQTPDYK